MSITDELRAWAEGDTLRAGMSLRTARDQALAIADRIDAAVDGMIELPKDADGEAWHIGDRTESGQTIEAMGLNKHGWHFVGTVNEIDPAIHRHYHAPTVEDVLREFAYGLGVPVADSYIAASAAKLRLAEEEDA